MEDRTSSIEALALFSAQTARYDLVITDMTMPNMTGDRLVVELMHIRPGIPIILCTGYSDPFLRQRARRIGVNALAMKPMVAAEMAEAVRGHWAIRRMLMESMTKRGNRA